MQFSHRVEPECYKVMLCHWYTVKNRTFTFTVQLILPALAPVPNAFERVRMKKFRLYALKLAGFVYIFFVCLFF